MVSIFKDTGLSAGCGVTIQLVRQNIDADFCAEDTDPPLNDQDAWKYFM